MMAASTQPNPPPSPACLPAGTLGVPPTHPPASSSHTDQVLLWRRSYTTRPPPLERSDPRHPRFDLRYRGLPEEALPDTESLQVGTPAPVMRDREAGG